MQPVFEINTVQRFGEVWLLVEGELDIATAPLLAEEIIKAERTNALAVVLDLSQTSFIDSTGVRVLVEAENRSQQNGKRLRIAPVPGAVEKVLNLCGVLDRFTFVR